jgi:microsomal dipeptidase-like Zn-dependent dipeptidase
VKWSTGFPRFTQADLSNMVKGNMRLAVVALCTPEKEFLFNLFGTGPFSAHFCNLLMGLGYQRVRFVQTSMDYFEEFCQEYRFFLNSPREKAFGGEIYRWSPAGSGKQLAEVLARDREIALVFSIEGAHIFNSGLGKFGLQPDEARILTNIQTLKSFPYPPAYITLNHFYDNDLCGHARCLSHLPRFADQERNLGNGITPLGERVIHALLEEKPILIDIKHMSLKGRKQYYALLEAHYPGKKIPILASHGAVTGVRFDGSSTFGEEQNRFYSCDINFFDEEILHIARSGGLFGVQFDMRRIAGKEILKKLSWRMPQAKARAYSARIIWSQIRHVAELLDHHGLYAWGTASIGSDFDGFVNPLEGIWTMKDFPELRQALQEEANAYLKGPNRLTLTENRSITPEEVVDKFCYGNTTGFLINNF